MNAAATRATRPATVVCVVGEFKQGKSSLLNALLGQQACPVDDDLATAALTLLRHGESLKVTVRRRLGDQPVVEDIPPASLSEWVTESGNPGNERGVERVDVSLPHPLLARGLVLVDTPGMGSMGAGHAANTLAFLPFADGLVFVSDTSAELSAPEVEFLEQARELCPTVVLALTKTDLYSEWRRIAQLDAGYLAATGTSLPTVTLSAPVRALALARQDTRLDERSGYPGLVAMLGREIVDPAKAVAAGRAVVDARSALDQLEQPLRAERQVLDDPDRMRATLDELEIARERLEHLRGPGARWSTVVGDRVSDLGNDVSHRFRGAIRELSRRFDEEIETLKTPEDWDVLGRRLQTEVAAIVTEAFQSIASRGDAVAVEVVELLAEETLDLPPLRGGDRGVDLTALWGEKVVTEKGSRVGRGVSSTMTGLRGAQGGMIMFGMMGRFLPTGAAALLLSNPVTLGLGVAFGGMQLFDAHKRKLTQRRQMARMNVRQFLDDVQFEVSNAISEAVRELQRGLRDELTARVGELQRTYIESGRRAQETAQADEAGAAQRRAF
ncbi:MAG: dynamin family protein, partial [Acidimicrobiales bacterium]|nr:dynamin family protein [Acidimicrobiales bacterium]